MEVQYESSGSPLLVIIWLAVTVLLIVAMWKIFTKAGKPGWAAIVPIYNLVVLIQVAGKPLWFIALFFIPIANIVAMILIYVGLAKQFGKGGGFAAGLIFLPFIFFPILGFGSASYTAPAPTN